MTGGRLCLLLGAAAAVALPFVADAAGTTIGTATLALAYAVLALGLNVVVGFAGLLDLGYVAFFAIGSYTTAWLASMFVYDVNGGRGLHLLVSGHAAELPGIHVSFLLVLVASIALTTVAGALIGIPTLRLRGDYVAMVTLAFGEIVGIAAVNGDRVSIAGQPLTAARQGVTPIDRIDLPFLPPFTALDLRPWYFTALILLAVAVWVSLALHHSGVGRAWTALRDDEMAAVAAGVPAARMKLLAYATGAAFAGVAGVFLGSFNNTVSAVQFEFSFSILILAMVVVGAGSVWSVTIAAVTLSVLHFSVLPHALPADASRLSYAVYGVLLIVIVRARWGRRLPRQRVLVRRPTSTGAPRASRIETVGAWLGVWTPPRDRSVPAVPWRALSAGSVVALIAIGSAVALIAPRIQDAKSEASARDHRRAAANAAAARTRQRREQRARTGAVIPGARAVAIRRLEAEIGRDARLRFDERARAAECEPVGGQPVGARRVVFDCFVPLREIVGAGAQAGARGEFGLPYRAVIDSRRHTYAFCKANPRPGERLIPDPDSVVALPSACR
jgi:branched-chain amino acid transport system permease protein